ncbi:hypothetical protein J3R30DRAFT_1040748 [Lentinula aciculospora]|uniref:Uncharacterized protein n=1 Tax=Lentinula aciculospora TaxID=153920 RepID=A0A9W9A2G1_9AGAR|nr:hypothetical protein J3R30DRAFT_1040748 [Lentinula aciculospora]
MIAYMDAVIVIQAMASGSSSPFNDTGYSDNLVLGNKTLLWSRTSGRCKQTVAPFRNNTYQRLAGPGLNAKGASCYKHLSFFVENWRNDSRSLFLGVLYVATPGSTIWIWLDSPSSLLSTMMGTPYTDYRTSAYSITSPPITSSLVQAYGCYGRIHREPEDCS